LEKTLHVVSVRQSANFEAKAQILNVKRECWHFMEESPLIDGFLAIKFRSAEKIKAAQNLNMNKLNCRSDALRDDASQPADN